MDINELIKNDKAIQEFLLKIPDYIKLKFVPIIYQKDSIVMEKGENTKYAYIILKGDLRVVAEFEDGNNYLFGELKPLSFISDLEALSLKLVNAVTVITVEESILLRLDIADFLHFLKTDIKFLMMVSVSLAEKMFQRSFETGSAVYKTGYQKVILYLLKCCREQEPKLDKPLVLKTTRPTIASEIGISIKTLNRSIQKLKILGLIQISKGKVNITLSQHQELLKLSHVI